MYVIGFNGPPYSGKDTLAEMLARELIRRHPSLPILQTSLSIPLRWIAYAMVNRVYPDPILSYNEFKITRFPQYGGITGRQLMIDVSERFLKTTYGQSIMAELWFSSLPEWMHEVPCVVMIRDSGFQIEVDPIIEHVGRENFLVCGVHRPGTSFEGDSREWVSHPDPYMTTMIHNTGSLDDLQTEAGRLYGRLVNQKGWVLA